MAGVGNLPKGTLASVPLWPCLTALDGPPRSGKPRRGRPRGSHPHPASVPAVLTESGESPRGGRCKHSLGSLAGD
eukprot:2125229-Pyramimonas_sp.AAC.1